MSVRAKSGDPIGVALTHESVCVAATGASVGDEWRAPIAMDGGSNGATAELAQALRRMAADGGSAGGGSADGAGRRLTVALLPPLTEVRTISLPPLKDEDRTRLLARNAGRYFVSARGSQVVGTLAPPNGGSGESQAVVAAAAPHALISAIHSAAATAGFLVDAVLPAEAAWCAAAVAIWPQLARGDAFLIVAHDARADLLSLTDGQLAGVRRFLGARDAENLAGAISSTVSGRTGARVFAIGRHVARDDLARALVPLGVRPVVPGGAWVDLAASPEGLAARFASLAAGPRLKSDETRALEVGAARRVAWWLAGAAAAILVVSAAASMWGARRELARLRTERAALRSQIQSSLVGRSSVETAFRQLAAVAGSARRTPQFSALLASITSHLPDDASITTFRIRGDSVFLDGAAEHAAHVFDDVARTPGLLGVRATAAVRREDAEGVDPLEHFSLGAKVAPRKP